MTGKEFNNIYFTVMLEKRKTVSRAKIQLFYRRALTALLMEHRQCSMLDKVLSSQGITHTNEFNYQRAFVEKSRQKHGAVFRMGSLNSEKNNAALEEVACMHRVKER